MIYLEKISRYFQLKKYYLILEIPPNKLNKILKDLENKKIIVFRKFKNAYALFSGSDIDLEEVTSLNKSKIKMIMILFYRNFLSFNQLLQKNIFIKQVPKIFQRFCLVLTSVKKTGGNSET